MKVHAHYGFIALLFLGLASCGKSNTSKIANNWGVTSSEEEHTYVSTNGWHNYVRTSFTETTISIFSEQTPGGGPTTTSESLGKVTENTLDIKKDGTWTWNQELFYEGNQSGMWVHTTLKTVQSGTWNFAAKTKGDDFKKNERIVFNILSQTRTSSQTQDQVLMNNSSNTATFLTGENMLIYTIVKSKSKELELKLEKASQSTMNGEVSNETLTQKMSLKEI
jgi:hypothetical protein